MQDQERDPTLKSLDRIIRGFTSMWMRKLFPLFISFCCTVLFLSVEAHDSNAGLTTGMRLVALGGVGGGARGGGFGGGVGDHGSGFGGVSPRPGLAGAPPGEARFRGQMSQGSSFPSAPSPSLVHIPQSIQSGFGVHGGAGSHNRAFNEMPVNGQLTGPEVNFRGRDYNHLTPEQHNVWRRGYWDHGYHNGYSGWWWVTGGLWYYYPEPIYPYPIYISDYLYPAPAIVSRQYWYYCSDPPGYYPDVTSCYDAWQVIPTMPPGVDPTALSDPVSPDVRAGYRVARAACSTCHMISQNQPLRPLVQQPGPSFMDIAKRPDTSAESLETFITNTGWNVASRPITMPHQGLSKQATQQVVEYIMSLRS